MTYKQYLHMTYLQYIHTYILHTQNILVGWSYTQIDRLYMEKLHDWSWQYGNSLDHY